MNRKEVPIPLVKGIYALVGSFCRVDGDSLLRTPAVTCRSFYIEVFKFYTVGWPKVDKSTLCDLRFDHELELRTNMPIEAESRR